MLNCVRRQKDGEVKGRALGECAQSFAGRVVYAEAVEALNCKRYRPRKTGYEPGVCEPTRVWAKAVTGYTELYQNLNR
jgi:hypothetical protein